MVDLSTLLFSTVVALLFVHELDAIRQREWRFFFAPFDVSDETAYRVFTALHAPLFVAVLWALESTAFQLGFDAFAIAHGGVHAALRNHPLVAFDSRFSRTWIYGAALLGAVHLLVVL